jgi:oligosaccharide reducing-end xylanase
MTPSPRARFCMMPIALSVVTLLAPACGTSSDESSSDAPASGAIPGTMSPSSPPGSEERGSEQPSSEQPGSEQPGGTETPVTSSEGPTDGVALAPSEAATGTGEAPASEQPETPLTPAEPEPAPQVPPSPDRPARGTANLFTDLLGIPVGDVDAKVRLVVDRLFGIGTNEPAIPQVDTGYRIYYELPQDPSQAFIWCADENDVRSEGQSYGMMIAVQMNMQTEFDKLWRFAQQRMQFATNDAWNRYFRWQGQVTVNGNDIDVNFGQNGPAPDGDEYFAAALYLADRRWGSNGTINYEQEADAIASAMLNNTGNAQGRVPIIDAPSNMVVFFPQGNSAGFSDPSYHLPAFYELFAQDGNPADANRWRQIATVSRQFFVQSADANTGLHPDYANFNGTPNTGGNGQTHDQFRFDAWRVPMNMAIDYAWTGPDARLQAQVDKYHAFFGSRLGADNIPNALFQVNGTLAADDTGPSTALAATLAAGALASTAQNRADFVENLWNTPQQSGTYRYYQEAIYTLGLLATAGWFGYEWPSAQ